MNFVSTCKKRMTVCLLQLIMSYIIQFNYLYSPKFKPMKNITLLISLFLITSAYSQQKLTIEDAVMGQYQKFYPEQLISADWIPNSDNYSFLDGYINLAIGKAKSNDEPEVVLNIQEVNQAVDSKFYYFQNLHWIDAKHFTIHNEQGLINFNIEEKQGTFTRLESDADHVKVHQKTGHIAYTIDNNIKVYNHKGKVKSVTKHKDKNIVSGQAISRSEMGISDGLFWSPDGMSLAFYQKDESAVHDYPIVDIEKTPGTLKNIKYPMVGQASEKVKVGIYHLNKRRVRYITPRSGEESYLTNLAWTPDKKHLIIVEVNRDQKHFWVNLYNSKNGKFIRTLFEENRDTWVEPQHAPYFLGENADDFVWISDRDGFNNLYLYGIDGILKKQLTKNQFMLTDIVTTTEQNIFFNATGENPMNSLIYKVDLDGNQTLITKNEGTHTAAINTEKELLIDTYSTGEIPNRVVLADTEGEEIQELLLAENPLEDYAVGETELVTLESKSGESLYARVIKPTNFDPSKKYPVLFYVYGGPHAQLVTNNWLNGASLWMHWMAAQGYIVFTLDNRGSANRGVSFEHSVHRRLGELELEDQLTGVEYLSTLPYADTSQIAVHGWSYGGFMTCTMLMQAADIFKVGVAGGPVTDWKYYEIMYGERYMDTPKQNPEGYKANSLLNNVEKLKGDLLLIHGTADDVVVMQHNMALIKKFIEKGIQVDFFPYPMHKHNVRGKDRVHLMEKVLNYIIEHNTSN